MSEYLASPTTYDANVLVVLRIHPDEEQANQVRDVLLLKQPIEGVALVDGFSPQAVPRGQRCLNNLRPYGNLSLQFGEDPIVGTSPPTVQELKTLEQTRRRAGELLEMSQHFPELVDVHGCGTYYPTLAWVGGRPTPAALAVAYALNPRMGIVVRGRDFFVGRAERGVSVELADDDRRGAEFVVDLIRRMAVGQLVQPTTDQLEAMSWYEIMGGTEVIDTELLKDEYGPMEELSSSASECLGTTRQTFMLAWTPDLKIGEVVAKTSPPRVLPPNVPLGVL